MFTLAAFSSFLAHCRLFLAAILLLANFVVAAAQIRSVTDGYTPLGLAPGAPAGSYGLSGFENVNPYNGGLNFSLPIKHVSGRGGASYTIQVPIETKWRAETDEFCDPETGQCWHFETPIYGDWKLFNSYGPGELMGRRAGTGVQPQNIGCHYYQATYLKTVTRLTFTVPGGTEYELRDQLLGGQPATVAYCAPGPASRGTVFVTTDGTSATFVSDTPVYDEPMPGYEPIIFPSGYLMLKDGTRYRIDDGNVSWMRDRNGNKLIFTPMANGFTVTDSLNRQITVQRVTDVAPYGVCDRITFKGFGGTPRVVRVSRSNLGSALRSGSVLQSPYALWPELNNASPWGLHDPEVISRIWLPDGRSYKFRYNSYGELARAELPTGGAIEYDWAPGVNGSSGGGAYCTMAYNVFAYRRVIERRVYANGGSGGAYDSKMTFSRPESTSGYCTFSDVGYVNVKEFDSGGTLLSSARHYYYGSPTASFINSAYDPTTYPSWREGKEWQTEMLAADDTSILRRLETSWYQRAAVSWWTGSETDAPANDPRITSTTTTLVDTNQVSAQAFTYDDTVPFNNISDVYEYDFGPGTPGALLRRTHTDYLTTNPVNGINYTTASVHIRNLPAQQQVFDAVGEKARTTFEYDNYIAEGSHAALVNRTGISGFDASFTTDYRYRGNLTRKTNWILSTSTQLHSYSQYDIAGNVVKVIDARGYQTTLDFSDCFGAPNGNARLNSSPVELSSVGQASYAFPTSVTNALNQPAYAQFDYYLGQPVDGEDLDGIVASGYYEDSLDRPTQVKRAGNTSAASHSTFAYDDANRVITTTSDLNTNNDGALVAKLLYDPLGRTIETRQYEGGANYIAVQTQYDALGRAYKTSNPFRPWQSETAVWTTRAFDALGRLITATTPDSAVVTTSYLGNAVTVTDQAGKTRKSVMDGLGRLTAVYEDPNGLNYQTSYAYDGLDNLTSVTQGVQTRNFVYDSLRRLTSATNPESGTVRYTYDNNGNVLTRVDARSITTTMAYDALNRLTSKTYNDNPQTPAVNYFYDAQTLPAGAPGFDRGYSTGRLVGVTYGGTSEGTYRGYDQMGRVVRQYQRTDSVNYLVEASYYANGSVQHETYPAVPGAADRRVVSYTNDSAGRLAALSSGATSYAAAASVSSIAYASHNGLKTETYGNDLIHAITYNNRLQPNEIKLGTSAAPASMMGLVYSYGTTTNNGNVQIISYSGGGLSYTQTFGYDALNRLTSSQENSGSSWSETNGYDRYGNRWIDLGGGSQSLYFNTSNNRITGRSYDTAGNLLNDGYHSYTYDGENKISKVDGVSAYGYNGEGQRVRKLVGENTRFIYGIGAQLVAEFDGATGNLRKEYVYGGASLITIEPTAVNSNGTQYTTSDILGSPRVITKAGGIVASRHDYQPFGTELGAGVGGRTTGMGFSNGGDTNRKKFTQYERDTETGLDYAQARYYSSSEGRFTTADPLMASATPNAPQSWNRYSYGLNNPLKYIDPSGLTADDIGTAEDQQRQQEEQQRQQQPAPAPPVDLRKDKIITAAVDKIRQQSKPLPEGEAPKLSAVKVIVGETSNIKNGSYIDGYGDEVINFTGVVRPIAYVALDQRENIIDEGNGVAILETVKTISGEEPDTSDRLAPPPPGGVFIDVQALSSGKPTTTIQQAVFVGQFPRSGPATTVFRTATNEIVKNSGAGTVSVKIGETKKVR